MSTLVLRTNLSDTPQSITSSTAIQDIKDFLHGEYNDQITVVKIEGILEEQSDMSYMFARMPALKIVDVSKMNTNDNLIAADHMFYSSPNLLTINAPEKDSKNFEFDTSKCTDLSWMFAFNAVEKSVKEVSEEHFLNLFNRPVSEMGKMVYYFLQNDFQTILNRVTYYTIEQFKEVLYDYFIQFEEEYINLLDDLKKNFGTTFVSSLMLPDEFKFSTKTELKNFANAIVGEAFWTLGGTMEGELNTSIKLKDYLSTSTALTLATIESKLTSAELGCTVQQFYDDSEEMFNRFNNYSPSYNSNASVITQVNIVKIINILKTDNATNLQGLFYGCGAAFKNTLLNLYPCVELNTEKATNMSYMFAYVNDGAFGDQVVMSTDSIHRYRITSPSIGIPLKGLKTSNVTDMSYMFEYCTMFSYSPAEGCYGSWATNLPWEFSNVKYLDGMFKGCHEMDYILLGDPTLIQGKTEEELTTFDNEHTITPLSCKEFLYDVCNGYETYVSSTTSLPSCGCYFGNINFSQCTDLSSAFSEDGQYILQSSTTYYYYPDLSTVGRTFKDFSKVTSFKNFLKDTVGITLDMSDWQLNKDADSYIDFSNAFNGITNGEVTFGTVFSNTTIKVDHTFYNFWMLASLDLSSTSFYGDELDFSGLFYRCGALNTHIYLINLDKTKITSLDDFNTDCPATFSWPEGQAFSNLTSIKGWGAGKTLSQMNLSQFSNAPKLENISYLFKDYVYTSGDDVFQEVIDNINLSNVTDMRYAFYGTKCLLTNFDNFDTSNVTKMGGMFQNVTFENPIDFSSLVVPEDAPALFKGVTINSNVKLDTLDVGAVFDFSEYFSGSTIESLTPLEGFIGENCKGLYQCFYCATFPTTTLDFTSLGWDTSWVKNFNSFLYYADISSLNLTGLSFVSVTSVNKMCYTSLTYANMGDFLCSQELDISYMFNDFDNEGNFVLSDNFKYENLTSYSDVNNVQFYNLIVSNINKLTVIEKMFQNNTYSYDSFVEEWCTQKHWCSVNENGEIVVPERVKSLSKMFYSSTFNEGTKDFIIRAEGALDVSSMFYSCNTDTNLKVIAPRATNFKDTYRNITDRTQGNRYSEVTDEETEESISLSAGTWYFYFDSSGYSSKKSYIKLSDDWLYIDGKEGEVDFVQQSGTNTWYSNFNSDEAPSFARACFSITLSEDSSVSFSYYVPTGGATIYCYYSKIPVMDMSSFSSAGDEVDVTGMFSNSHYLELILDNMDLSSIINIKEIFTEINVFGTSLGPKNYCRYISAKELNFPATCTDLSNMFYDSYSAAYIDASDWSGPEVLSLEETFSYCEPLRYLNVSNLNMPKLQILKQTFYASCTNTYNFGKINISNWTTGKVTTMQAMFRSCQGLRYIDMTNMSNFDTTELNNLYQFMMSCPNLVSPNLSWINTKNVFYMRQAFQGSLQGNIDLSSWSVDNCMDFYRMFNCCKCSSLNISGWTMDTVAFWDDMFCNMDNMTSINMTNFDFGNIETIKWIFSGSSNLSSITGPFKGNYVTSINGIFTSTKIENISDSLWDFPNLYSITQIGPEITGTLELTKTYPNLKKVSYLCGTVYSSTEQSTFTFTIDAPNLESLEQAFWGFANTTIDLSGCNIPHVYNFKDTFNNCVNLQNVIFPVINPLDNADASMKDMFYGCSSLSTIDLSNISFKYIKDMSFMFYNSGITTTNFGGDSFDKVTTIDYMFSECSNIQTADLSEFIMPELTTAEKLFYNSTVQNMSGVGDFITGAPKLTAVSYVYNDQNATSINLSNIDAPLITTFENFIVSAPQATSITFENSKFDSLTLSNPIFTNNSITSISYKNFEAPLVTELKYLTKVSTNLESIDLTNANLDGVVSATEAFQDTKIKNTNFLGDFDFSKVTSFNYMFKGCESLTRVSLENIKQGRTFESMFEDCTSLQSIILSGDGSEYDTYSSIDLDYMFKNCENLAVLDLSNFSIPESKRIALFSSYEMFKNCKAIQTIDLSKIVFGWGNGSSLLFNSMFEGCEELTTLKFFNYIGSQTYTDAAMNSMFKNCKSLTSVDLSEVYLRMGSSRYINICDMFNGCTALTTVKMPTNASYTGTKITNTNLFKNCSSLTSVNLTFPLGVDCTGVFEGCSSLTKIPNFSNTATAGLIFDRFLYGCSSLVKISCSWFVWERIASASEIFCNCTSLTTINCAEDNTKIPTTEITDMFSGCTNLVGNAGSENEKRYSETDISSAYAQCTDGYFTLIPISFFLNGTECHSLYWNGNTVSQLYWNGTKIF